MKQTLLNNFSTRVLGIFFVAAIICTAATILHTHALHAQTENVEVVGNTPNPVPDQFAGYPAHTLTPKMNRSLLFLGTTAAVAGMFLIFGGATILQRTPSVSRSDARSRVFKDPALAADEE